MVDESRIAAVIADRPESLGRMFFDRVHATPGREAYRYPDATGWTSVTWQQTGDRVQRIAAGLVSLGVQPEERVAIVSGTRFEWILADLAVLSAGAATTTVYPASLASEVAFIVGDSESRIAFAEDDRQVAKLREHRAELPTLRKVVVFDGTADTSADEDGQDADDGAWVITLSDLEALGADLLTDQPAVVERRTNDTRPDQLATLIYTSGTTGTPKGVRLPHSAWTYEGAAVQSFELLSHDDLQFLWLPLAHSFGKVLLSAQLAVGFPTAVDGRVDRIIDNLAEVQPTFMGAAPRIFEKAYARITTMIESESRVRRKIFEQAFRVGREVDRLTFAGKKVPRHLALQRQVFDRLVFAKIRERFGGRLRFFVSGAAALDREIALWFHAAGILILEGYGLTETSAGTCINLPDDYRIGTVGQPFPGSEFRVADDGELLIKGPGVMAGYHKHESATADALVDGWLYTGDIGEIDAEGFVRITDRKKDLFKTSGGKYVAPQLIESRVKAVCPYASNVLVHGNERNYVTALVTLDADSLGEWASQNGLAGRSYAEIVTSDRAHAMVQAYVDQVNTTLNRWETIKRFVILERDLSIDEGEITPSLKVKRKVVEEHYRDRLDALYT